ncbi:MAG: hypothetical protein ACQESR_13145 [Planctomycetota bacterium]
MTRFTPLGFTSLAFFAFLAILAYAAPALASPGRWQREYERHRKETVRQQRERELDAVRHSTQRAKEELRHWYQSQRNKAKRRHTGFLARGHGAPSAAPAPQSLCVFVWPFRLAFEVMPITLPKT